MDFYSHQEKAQKRTGLLILLFSISWFLISALASTAVIASYYLFETEPMSLNQLYLPIAICFAVVTIIILMASAIRLHDLSSNGGASVALQLGGKLISPNNAEAKYQQLLNIVEEMAIASGVPVPPVYVLEEEGGINAFAAGMSIDNAAIGITRGALKRLNREELQGVIAHEFSHILNGDMRINTKLIGALFGITFLGMSGQMLLEGSSHHSTYSHSRNSDSDSGKGLAIIFVLGIALIIIGWVGTLFGSMIKAAISRQREFLADASAVQFTRNNQGITDALLKIGGLHRGSYLENRAAQDISHMMFGRSAIMGTNAWFATHPPLEERIKRINPKWNGEYIKPQNKANLENDSSLVSGFTSSIIQDEEFEKTPLPSDIGKEIISQIPQELVDYARDPYTARLIPLLLIADGSELHQQEIERHVPMVMIPKIAPLLVNPLPPHLRFPLLELAAPALKSLSPGQANRLIGMLHTLAKSDDHYSLAEWCLINLVEKMVQPSIRQSIANKSATQLKSQVLSVLGNLTHYCHSDSQQALNAFKVAVTSLGWAAQELKEKEENLSKFSLSLSLLVQLKPKEKQNILNACRLAIESDGKITVDETELFRVIAAFLEIATPPLQATKVT